MTPEKRLVELGIELPPVFAPVGNYLGCKRSGSLLFVGGHGPTSAAGVIGGKVGADVSLERGREAARATALPMLATVRAELGSLDRVIQVVKVFGMVSGEAADEDIAHTVVLESLKNFFRLEPRHVFAQEMRRARCARSSNSSMSSR